MPCSLLPKSCWDAAPLKAVFGNCVAWVYFALTFFCVLLFRKRLIHMNAIGRDQRMWWFLFMVDVNPLTIWRFKFLVQIPFACCYSSFLDCCNYVIYQCEKWTLKYNSPELKWGTAREFSVLRAELFPWKLNPLSKAPGPLGSSVRPSDVIWVPGSSLAWVARCHGQVA